MSSPCCSRSSSCTARSHGSPAMEVDAPESTMTRPWHSWMLKPQKMSNSSGACSAPCTGKK
eukprot:6949836-Alexandrium_andersonii.AAC.1